MMKEMKTIGYRGGIVTFRIPSHWKEEYEPEGGGSFYEDMPETGTLRLNIITSEAPHGSLPPTGYEVLLHESINTQAKILRLPNGDGLKHYLKTAEEEGTLLEIHFWEIAHCVPPKTLYLAIFSWTIPAVHAALAKSKEEIQMIVRELTSIRFHPDL